jgi:hypothetical protein
MIIREAKKSDLDSIEQKMSLKMGKSAGQRKLPRAPDLRSHSGKTGSGFG